MQILPRRKLVVSLLALTLLLLPLSMSISSVSAASTCPSYTSTTKVGTYTVTARGANGSCPGVYSNSGIVHFAFSDAAKANPYTITITFSPSQTPTSVIAKGWPGPQVVFCSGNCAAGGPWTGQVSATVQSGQACNTENVQVSWPSSHGAGTSTPDTMLILEAGVCVGIPLAEMPLGAIGAVLVPLAALGSVLALRKKSVI